MQFDVSQTDPSHRPDSRGTAEDRLRVLELEQTRLLARHEAVVAQLSSMRSAMRGLERLLELRLQRLEQLGRRRFP